MGDFQIVLCLMCTLPVSFPLQIYFDSRVVGERDRNNTKLECSFTKDGSEEIINLRFLAKNRITNDLIQIARFVPDRPSILLSGGKYLTGRVTLTNLTSSSTSAILNFQPLKCVDEKEYQCLILYFNAVGDQNEQQRSTNLSVIVNPSVPHIMLDTSSAVEGDTITITCMGDVGKPPGRFIWEKRMNGIVSDSYNVTTETNKILDSCSYNGYSNLTSQVTDKDDNAVIRCYVRNMNGGVSYSDTQPLHVKYKVRQPSITRQPDQDEYVQASSSITLTCIGRGNPQPSYIWYKDEDIGNILSFSDTLYITEVITNNSGIYRCKVTNYVSGFEYIQSTSVTIMIVLEKSDITTTTTTNIIQTQDGIQRTCAEGIVFGVIAAVLLISLVVVLISCWTMNRNIRLKYEKTYDHLRLGDSQVVGSTDDAYDGIITDGTANVSQYTNWESAGHAQLTIGQRTNYENQRTDDRYEYAYVNPANS